MKFLNKKQIVDLVNQDTTRKIMFRHGDDLRFTNRDGIDVFAKIRERGRDFIREPDEFECCYYKLSVPNKGTDEIYCLPFDDKMFACEFREKFGFVS